MSAPKIVVISTGGTFEKTYPTEAGARNFSFSFGNHSYVHTIAQRFGIPNLDVLHMKMKDSQDMTVEDREQIASICLHHTGLAINNPMTKQCIVIHGTDTMIDTARLLASKKMDLTIVLTGSRTPACVRDSDAELNFGGALIATQVCPSGVYIVMNGKVFAWDKCAKDAKTGLFYEPE